MCGQVLIEARKGVGSLGTGFKVGCDLPDVGAGTEPGSGSTGR